MDWSLECSDCGATRAAEGLPTVCTCGQPWLVRYPARRPGLPERDALDPAGGMWRFRPWLPLEPDESPISLGEGDTPLLHVLRTGQRLGLERLFIKDEAVNPTGSFKARGLSAAITRAVRAGQTQFVIPTAGNAGVAASAYTARAGASVKVFAPASTPPAILAQIVSYGGNLVRLEGHIGDCGRAAKAHAVDTGAMDLSTLREPYRIEGKKTLGIELALAFGWELPDVIVYPTGGGTGLIGMWKAFLELRGAGWIPDRLPRMVSVQSAGCAPIVRAYEAGDPRATTWADPHTVASGLRVPGPLGDRLILRALRESAGTAIAVTDDALAAEAARITRDEGIDMSPEGGAAAAAARELRAQGWIRPEERVVVFNTGAGWLYRVPSRDLPGL
ncbi:MAG: threonine synthase [Gemmatimonadales bacterium]